MVDIHEVVSQGAIVASSRDLQLLVTSDGNFFVVWQRHLQGWQRIDSRVIAGDYQKLTMLCDLVLKAEAYLEDLKNVKVL